MRGTTAQRPRGAAELARAKAQAQRFARQVAEDKRGRARWLWCRRLPIAGTPAERYLRDARSHGGLLPATIGFLPARGNYSSAMIAAFGMPAEIEDGISIPPEAVQAVHLTRLAADGSRKAGTDIAQVISCRQQGKGLHFSLKALFT